MTSMALTRTGGWITSLLMSISSDHPVQYRLSTYPAKPTALACHHLQNSRLCDPDAILNESIIFPLEDNLETRNVTLPSGNDVPVQYGVAVMNNMDLTTGNVDDAMDMFYSEPEKAAEIFARHIHNTWGVGSAEGTGVLLFLSVNDRTIYFSRGKAVERVLRDSRLDAIIEKMKPLLREQQYDQALLVAISELDKYLQAGEELGPFELLLSWLEKSVMLLVLGFVAYQIRRDLAQRREYTRVASQLSALDRARAEALQGHYKATSCPICLEDFVRRENVEKPAQEETPEQMIGSDGLDLKLLRCGHAFDETCWLEWVNNGNHRNIEKCPICQQNVGSSPELPSSSTVGLLSIPRGGQNDSHIVARDGSNSEERIETIHNLAMRQYTQDRNFRLLRLAARYPQYVQRNQLQRWTEVSYNGSMANDASLARDAAIDECVNKCGSSSGFLGGTSSGGHGGSW